jgi:hypothetical protein
MITALAAAKAYASQGAGRRLDLGGGAAKKAAWTSATC